MHMPPFFLYLVRSVGDGDQEGHQSHTDYKDRENQFFHLLDELRDPATAADDKRLKVLR